MSIKDIQAALLAAGFDPKGEDGLAGANTYAAIRAFQSSRGLTADGVLRWETLTLLLPEFTWASTLPARALQVASLMVGIREEQGANEGVMVDAILKDVGLDPGASWCMAFVVWCYDQAAAGLGTKSPLIHTGGCLDQLHRTSCPVMPSGEYTDPVPGDIGILDLGEGHGHTFMVVSAAPDGKVNSVEGNTNDDGSANGNGAYFRQRTIAKTKAFIRVNN